MQHLQTVKRGQAAPHSTLESSRLFSSHDNAPYMPLWSRCPKQTFDSQYPPYLLFSSVPNNPVSGTFGLKPRKSAVKARSFHPHQAKSKVFTQLPRGPIQPCPTHLSNEWHLLCPPSGGLWACISQSSSEGSHTISSLKLHCDHCSLSPTLRELL